MGVSDAISIPDETWSRPAAVEALRDRDAAGVFALAERHGVSQTRLAVAIELTQPRISAIKNGRQRVRSLGVWQRIADGMSMPSFARNLIGLGGDSQTGPAATTPLAAGLRDFVQADLTNAHSVLAWDADRLPHIIAEHLFSSNSGPAPVSAVCGSEGSPAATVREVGLHLMNLDFKLGGGATRRLLLQYVGSDVLPLLQQNRADLAHRDLLSAAAETLEVLAWSAYDDGHHGHAQHYFTEALQMAGDAGNRALGAALLGKLSHQANYLGRPHEAVQLARAGRSEAQGSPTVEAMLIAMEARALATDGAERDCAASLSEAERLLDRRDPDSDPAWIAYFDTYELAGEAAHCFRDLGVPARALEYASQAADEQHVPARTRGFISMVQAAAVAQIGDLEHALTLATESTRLVGPLQSRRYQEYLTGFGDQILTLTSDPVLARSVQHLLASRIPPSSPLGG